MSRVTLILVCSLLVTTLLSQDLTPSLKPAEVLDPDSLILRYVQPKNFYNIKEVQPDSIDASYHMYDPARGRLIDMAHLGNLGSAHRHQFFDLDRSKGLDFGTHQYDIYGVTFDDFKFYEAQTAVTDLYYSQGIGQQDGFLKAEFGRNFAKGVKLSLDYLRINQEGAYINQRAKHTGFGLGVWYTAPKGNYDGLYHYLSNSIVQEDNGGISDYSFFDDPMFLTANVPVYLSSGLSTHRERVFTIQNHFHLVNTKKKTKAKVDVIQTTQIRSKFIKYTDAQVSDDSTFYESFVTDRRGIRHFIDARQIKNSLDLRFGYDADSLKVLNQTIQIGLEHRNTNLDQEPIKSHVNELFINGYTSFQLSKWLRLWGRGYLSVWDRGGDFLLDANMETRLENLGTLSAGLEVYRRTPYLIEQAFFVTQTPIWENNFNSVQSTAVHGDLHISALDLRAKASIYRLDNYIYYNENRIPVQLSSATNIFQLVLKRDFKLGGFGIDNTVALQSVDNDNLALPRLILKHQLYYTGRLFRKRLGFRAGADLSMTNAYDGVSYFPVSGQFHLSIERQIPQYPVIDLFLSIKVSTFRGFIKFENLSAAFREDLYEQIVGYPQFEQYFRFGVSMELYN